MTRTPGPRFRRRCRWLAAALAMSAQGCDFPTELPEWDTSWVVPGEETRIVVDSILPAGLRSGPGATFILTLPPASVSRTLGELCGAPCTAAAGQTVPKPPFTATFGGSIPLPRDVLSVAITGGQIQVDVRNDLGFDPLRPGASARGFMVLTASNGGRRLATDSIAGEGTALPSGGSLTRTLSLGAETVAGPIAVDVRISSPPGDPVLVDPARSVSLTATPGSQITVTQASVAVTNRTVIAEVVELDLDGFDDTMVDRTRGGAILIVATNPFQLEGTARITLTSPVAVVRKEVQIRPGTTTVRAPLTEQEMHSLLGYDPVRMRIDATVTAPSGSVTVRPDQVVAIDTRIELTLGPGGD